MKTEPPSSLWSGHKFCECFHRQFVNHQRNETYKNTQRVWLYWWQIFKPHAVIVYKYYQAKKRAFLLWTCWFPYWFLLIPTAYTAHFLFNSVSLKCIAYVINELVHFNCLFKYSSQFMMFAVSMSVAISNCFYALFILYLCFIFINLSFISINKLDWLHQMNHSIFDILFYMWFSSIVKFWSFTKVKHWDAIVRIHWYKTCEKQNQARLLLFFVCLFVYRFVTLTVDSHTPASAVLNFISIYFRLILFFHLCLFMFLFSFRFT